MNSPIFELVKSIAEKWVIDKYSEPVLSGYSKIDITKVLKPYGSLMQVKSILQYF